VCIIFTFALILVAKVTNYLDFFSPFLAVLTSESFVYFLNNGHSYSFINPMNDHGPGVKKQDILFSPLLAILVAMVTIFLFREFHEKHIIVYICSILNSRNTKFSGRINV